MTDHTQLIARLRDRIGRGAIPLMLDGDLQRLLDALEATQPDASDKTWCGYVAGIIGTFIGEPVESETIKGIAAIIARRLWALPSPKRPSSTCAIEHTGQKCANQHTAVDVDQAAQALIAVADTARLRVSVTRRPLQPLAMGHAEYVVETWPVRGAS